MTIRSRCDGSSTNRWCRFVGWLVLACGCGRIGIDPVSELDASSDGSIDGSIEGSIDRPTLVTAGGVSMDVSAVSTDVVTLREGSLYVLDVLVETVVGGQPEFPATIGGGGVALSRVEGGMGAGVNGHSHSFSRWAVVSEETVTTAVTIAFVTTQNIVGWRLYSITGDFDPAAPFVGHWASYDSGELDAPVTTTIDAPPWGAPNHLRIAGFGLVSFGAIPGASVPAGWTSLGSHGVTEIGWQYSLQGQYAEQETGERASLSWTGHGTDWGVSDARHGIVSEIAVAGGE